MLAVWDKITTKGAARNIVLCTYANRSFKIFMRVGARSSFGNRGVQNLKNRIFKEKMSFQF